MSVRVIAFNGPPRSGKDTGALAIKELRKVGMYHVPLAKILKEITCRFFDTPFSWHGYEGMKDKANGAFWGMTPREAYIWMSEEVIKPKFGKKFFGEQLVRYFFETFNDDVNYQKDDIYIVISDVGFKEEWEVLEAEFGWKNCLLMRIDRPGYDYSNDSRSYIFPGTEQEHHICDVDNSGTIEEFQTAVQDIARDFIRN